MKDNYSLLGKYIRQVDERNKTLEIDKLLGVSIGKKFIPSIANTVGTDFSSYKIVRHGQFAYGPVTSRNGEKVSIALLDEDDCIISNSYTVFEITDTNQLMPEYLMLWFMRPEFDRYARFKSHGSVREIFDWEQLCNVELPVPSIEKQRNIVKAYKAITDRIALKQRINDNLEATIEAMFRNYYSDISEDNCILLQELCELTSSKRVFADDYKDNGIPFYRGSEITLKHLGKPIISPLYISCEQYNALRKEYGVPQNGDILITAVGTIGNSYMVQNEDFYFKDGNIIWLRNFSKPNINYYIYDFMKSTVFNKILDGICIGSTQTALTIVSLSNVNVKIPDNEKLSYYTKRSKQIHLKINDNIKEIEQLQRIQSVLLSVLSR